MKCGFKQVFVADAGTWEKLWLESRSPPLSKQKKYNAHVFRPNGRGRANQGTPTTHRGHCDRRGAAGSACYEGGRGAEAAGGGRSGGGRRRPEATGGEARVKKRPFLFRSKEQRKKSAVAKQPQQPRTTAPVLAVAFIFHADDGANATSQRRQRQRGSAEERRGAVPEERTPEGPKRTPTEHHTQRHQRQQQRGQRKRREDQKRRRAERAT